MDDMDPLTGRATTRGSDSTRHRNPSHRCAQGSMEPRGLVRAAWVGLDKEQADIDRRPATANWWQRHDAVVNITVTVQSTAGSADNGTPPPPKER